MWINKNNLLPAILLIAFLTSGCNNDDEIISHGGTGFGSYSREIEPSLSADREYIYYVTFDNLIPAKDGIYRARLTDPVREKLLSGSGFHSPTVSFDNTMIAFLHNGRISYFRIAENRVLSSSITDNFQSIVYINENLLLGNRGDSLYLISESGSSVSFFDAGSDPTLFAPDTFVYLVELANKTYGIIMNTYGGGEEGFKMINEVAIDTIFSSKVPRWVSIEPVLKRFVYTLEGDTINYVYSSEVGSSTSNLIDATQYLKPYILNFDLIIYPGPDGRFYQSNFNGSRISPFWQREDVD